MTFTDSELAILDNLQMQVLRYVAMDWDRILLADCDDKVLADRIFYALWGEERIEK